MTTTNDQHMSHPQILAYLAAMRQQAHSIALQTTDNKFSKGDARDAILISMSNAIVLHCISLSAMLRASTCTDPTDAIIGETLIFMRDLEVQDGFWRKQRLHLFLDVWIGFEAAIRVLYGVDAVVSPQQRAKDSDNGRRSHLGIPTIWREVSRAAERSGLAKTEPRFKEVVEFLAHTRNTIHSNSIYHGKKNHMLKLDAQTALELIDGREVGFLSMAKLPRLIKELVDAAVYLRNGLSALPASMSTPSWLLQQQLPPAKP